MTPEQARELRSTILWSELCLEIDRMVDWQVSLLEKCQPGDLTAIQQNIATLRAVKNIPQNVIDREE